MDGKKIGLKDRLWNIKPDQDWESIAGIAFDKDSKPYHSNIVLERHFSLILSEIIKEYPAIESAFVSITGIKPGYYTPVTSIGRDIKEIVNCPQDHPTTLVSSFLLSPDKSKVKHFKHPSEQPNFVGISNTSSKVIVKLIASDELFGFVSLDTTSDQHFPQKLIEELNEIQPFLSRLIAESVFSMRLWELSKPLFSNERVSFNDLCQDIVKRAILSFGASGSVLRFCNDNNEVIDKSFSETADSDSYKVIQSLLEPDSIGEKICNEVLNSKEFDWTIGRLENSTSSNMHGMLINNELNKELAKTGIRCYSIFRIEKSGTELEKSNTIGTLSIFHLHDTGYSWRDVALAKQLVKRAADVITMHKQTLELSNTKDNLEVAIELLKIEGEMATRAEIVTLLSHDMGHKALAIQGWLDDYVSAIKRTIRTKQSFTSLTKLTEEGESAIAGLLTGMNTVNKLFNPARDETQKNESFKLINAIANVEATLSPALDRNNCSLVKDIVPRNLELIGNKEIFLLVLFNLMINSIDSQKTRRSQRPMTIKIFSSFDTSGKLVLNFNDTGPGINRQVFPVADDIFELGKSSKEKGTGRGLTISRNLLGQFYGGNLILSDSKNAHFKMFFPKNRFKQE